jgi:hypothetical protein
MTACEQKYCKYCVKPYFDKDGNFSFGTCKKARYLVLHYHEQDDLYYGWQPLYCANYEPRKRKINY